MNRFFQTLHRYGGILFGGSSAEPAATIGRYVGPGMTVLAAGAGTEKILAMLESRIGRDGRLFIASFRKNTDYNATPVLALHGAGENAALPLDGPEMTADFAVCIGVAEVAPDNDRLFPQISAAMRPAGTLLIGEPVHRIRKRRFDGMVSAAEAAGFIGRPGPVLAGYHTALLVRTC